MKKLFLVYGTLKAAHGNHRLIAHPTTKFLGNFVTEPKYTLFDGGFPVVERGGDTPITGELYEVEDPETIDDVFCLEGCSSKTQGHPDNWYDVEPIETPHGEAVMFVMDENKSGRRKIVESGIWH
jgi:gamma-glutamylcyclotransferase (GGCT)/AIG2-like uncharacterized protein YtfP